MYIKQFVNLKEKRVPMLEIDHIGYAVKNIEEAMEQMRLLGYSFGKEIKDEGRKVWIAFGNFKGYRVELVAPAAEGSPVDNILKYVGASPYHICYCSDDFDYDLKVLCGGGVQSGCSSSACGSIRRQAGCFFICASSWISRDLRKIEDRMGGQYGWQKEKNISRYPVL